MRLNTLTKLLLFLPLTSWAADGFTIYHPKYRSTEELVSFAESAFGGKANFSSLGGKVVINASSKTTASVLKLFDEVDKIARQFKISFRLVAKEESSGNSISFKNGQVSFGKKASISGDIRMNEGQSERQKDLVQSAQLMEGSEAKMALGNEWAHGGFSAKARGGAGDLVTVEFFQKEPNANPAFSLQGEVVLKLGEWKTVGEVAQAEVGSEKSLTLQGKRSRSFKRDLQVKLDLQK